MTLFNSKKTTIKTVLALIASLLVCCVGYYAYLMYLNPNIKVEDGDSEFLYVERDDTFEDVLAKLSECSCLRNKETFRQLAILEGYDKHIVPGRYALRNNMHNKRLLRNLQRGYQTPTKITFNNIRTKEQLAQKLSEQLMTDSTEIITLLNNKEYLQTLGLTPDNAVSIFIPNTYEVYWTISAEDLMERMQKEYERFWTKKRRKQAEETGLTRFEISTLASIVEEESNIADEKSTIAGLYINRLHRNIPLQADPTVRFALNDFTIKRVLREHLKTESPYNTYLNCGLPPGPIRIPSIADIDAVLNYERHNYLYMCAKEDLSGRHAFASSFSEHQKNAVRYRKSLNKLNIYK